MFRSIHLLIFCLCLKYATSDLLSVPSSKQELLSYFSLSAMDLHETCTGNSWLQLGSCLAELEEYDPNYKNPNIADRYNMLKLSYMIEHFAICFDISPCSAQTILSYITESIFFIIRNLYGILGDAYDCLLKSKLEVLYAGCSAEYETEQILYAQPSNREVSHRLKSIVNCVANRLQCEDNSRNEFLSAGHAGADLLSLFTEMRPRLVDALLYNVPYKSFDQALYENIQLEKN
uniref:Uncharacterized protein n=1 Tax=Caenorhabditis japonica TaxID=281687 RepID=A0A8R1EP17_CAEJA